MRSTVVPAQITTVEDRIAGNLTFSQVLLLAVPLMLCTATYLWLPPAKHLGGPKGMLIAFQFILFGSLAMRVKGRIVAEWLSVWVRFYGRPRIYVFTKNDAYSREAPTTVAVREEKPLETTEKKASLPRLTLAELEKLDGLISNESLTVRLSPARKGGIDVLVAEG